MSALIFITVSAVRTINLPAGVVVTKTRKGQIRIAPRTEGKRVLKEHFVEGDFVKLYDAGIIRAFNELPDNLKRNYPEAAAKVEG